MPYVPIKNLIHLLDINEGDNLMVSSDVTSLLYKALSHQDDMDLNVLIDSLIKVIGPKGSLIFPTYNWGFCQGKTFDYSKTRCKTGSLGTLALRRPDFVRTKHPIYSFAVWGTCRLDLYHLENTDSFSADSPFAYMKEHNFKQLFIDVSFEHSFTYVHYVEQRTGNIPYRYLKDFTADYIDNAGNRSNRTYSMFVRELDKDVHMMIDPMEDIFLSSGAEKRYRINDIDFKLLKIGEADPLIELDIKENRSRRLCTYIGQE